MHARKSEISKRTHFSRLAGQRTRPVAKRTHSGGYKGQPKRPSGEREAMPARISLTATVRRGFSWTAS